LIEFIFDMNNVLFTAALILTVAAFSIEAVGFMVAGIDLFGLVDAIIPDINFEVDGPDFDDVPLFHTLLGWAKHKDCPAAIWAVMLTGIFGTLGLVLQSVMRENTGHSLQAIYAIPACLIPTVFITSYIAKGLGERVFVDNTSAVTKESLICCQGYVTIGTATTDRAAEVSVKDKYGKTHLIMCRADKGKLVKNDIVKISQITGSAAIASRVGS
jgi:hypothetical protein